MLVSETIDREKMNFKDIKLLHEIEVIGKILRIRGQYGT